MPASGNGHCPALFFLLLLDIMRLDSNLSGLLTLDRGITLPEKIGIVPHWIFITITYRTGLQNRFSMYHLYRDLLAFFLLEISSHHSNRLKSGS